MCSRETGVSVDGDRAHGERQPDALPRFGRADGIETSCFGRDERMARRQHDRARRVGKGDGVEKLRPAWVGDVDGHQRAAVGNVCRSTIDGDALGVTRCVGRADDARKAGVQ